MKRIITLLLSVIVINAFAQNNVGIGTTTPSRKLHVLDLGVPTGITPNSNSVIVAEKKNGGVYISTITDTNHTSGILFGNQFHNADGGIHYNTSGNTFDLRFRTNGNNTRMTIDSIGRTGIGTAAPNSSAILDISSTNKGLLIPRMTSTQRKAIPNPAPGLMVYDMEKQLLFMFDGHQWNKLAFLAPEIAPTITRSLDSISDLNASLGESVDIDGEYAVVGAPQLDSAGIPAIGAAFIMKKNGGAWQFVQKLLPPGTGTGINFGGAVTISGDVVVIGAFGWDEPSNADEGGCFVFVRNAGSGVWEFVQKLAPGVAGDWFGYAVDFNGTDLVVGSPQDDGSFNEQGSIYFFAWNGATFTQTIKISAPLGQLNDRFGEAVALDGSYAVSGARNRDAGGISNRGIAYVYVKGGGTWTFQDSLNRANSTAFGRDVAISGSYVAVGEDGFLNRWHVEIFQRSGSSWNSIQGISSLDSDNSIGWVSLKMKNDQLIIGGPYEDHIEPYSGNVYQYQRVAGTYVQQKKISDITGYSTNPRFGFSVSSDGTYIIIGSPRANSNRGKVDLLTIAE